MRAILKDGVVEIVPDDSEELSIYRETVYPDRIVVFKTMAEDVCQEVHFGMSTAVLIDRASQSSR
jgi:hypothetical protein